MGPVFRGDDMSDESTAGKSALSEGAGSVGCVAADSAALWPGEGFELWHQACKPVLETASRVPLPAFQAAYEFFNVDGLVFNRTRYSATTFQHTPRHLRGSDDDMIVLHMLLRGGERGVADGHALEMGPDRIVMHDWSRPFASVAEDTEQLCVAIPRERIAARDWLHMRQPVVSWQRDSPQGMVLSNSLTSIWQVLPQATQDDAPALAAGFLGLLNGMLDPQARPVSDRQPAATLAAMQDYLRKHLARRSLGAGDLVDAFHCSRATVYRLFGELGGVRNYLREQRLAACFDRLSQAPDGGGSVARIAAECGFEDTSHFHRAFKQRFGMTPGELQQTGCHDPGMPGMAKDGAAVDSSLAVLHRWMGGAGK